MASADVAAPQVNGVATSSRAESPADSINSSTKRKRDANDDGEPGLDAGNSSKPQLNGLQKCHDDQSLIRNFFNVLQSHDTTTPAILQRQLPVPAPDGEPSLKRAKSEEAMDEPASIADKVSQGAYRILDDLMCDLAKVVEDQVKALKFEGGAANEDLIAQTGTFKGTALELYRRELSYPKVPLTLPLRPGQRTTDSAGSLVLSTFGTAPTLRPLFTSLQHSGTPDGVLKPLAEGVLPSGVTATKIYPDVYAASDKNARPLTLGELFPSPRNLPPLQPPKAPKNTTKSNVLTFYHPELTEKSKYRSGTYFSQPLSTGHWLDYSNATPAIHAKTKQRERAQSLAGVKPSSVELELSEMEALFRGAFSSFAPCKDDSAAIVPSSLISRIWWQRVGRRNFEKMNEEALEESEDEAAVDPALVMDIDDDLVKEAIENWDPAGIDPALDEVLGKKSDEDKEVDDLLDEVTDMIETLSSFQRNRNLTLPTSQDRYSADPNNGDMLRNGNASQQPSEEETMTYETLKAQLALIIQNLPPYAVARLSSDKLEELAVSTKIEVRSDEYRGVMEEDEPARLGRQAAQAAANANQRQAHRTPSVSSASYGNHQYPGQFQPSARPVGSAQHFPQTPVRPQGPNMYPRAPSTVPIPQPHHPVQARQPPPTSYRPGSGPQMYAPQLAKAQGPYGHSNIPQPYVNSPTQSRMQQPPHPNYMGQPGTPRYPQQGYQQGFPQQHQPIHPQHQQHPPHPQHQQQVPHHQQPLPQHPPQHPHNPQHAQHPSQAPFPPFANGASMPRTISPQIPQPNPYGQSPTPPQQHQQIPHGRPPYGPGTPGIAPTNMQQRPYPGSPGMMQGGNRPPSNVTGFATVMPEVQQRQLMEQARARADAEQRVSGHMGKVAQGEVVGLAGIGLGGQMDVHKMAAAKMQMGSNGASPAPRHAGPSPTPPINGTQTPVPVPHVPGAMQGVVPTPSPGPQGQTFVKPPVP